MRLHHVLQKYAYSASRPGRSSHVHQRQVSRLFGLQHRHGAHLPFARALPQLHHQRGLSVALNVPTSSTEGLSWAMVSGKSALAGATHTHIASQATRHAGRAL